MMIQIVEGYTSKKCTFLLAELWPVLYYGMIARLLGNLYQLVVLDTPVTCCASARFNLDL